MLGNVTDLKVNQIRVFAVDVVPMSLITTKSCVDKLRETLSIGDVETRRSAEGKEVLFLRRGEIRRDKKLIIIDRIEVDARRIVLEVEGTSGDGNEVYEAFVSTVVAVTDIDSDPLHAPLLKAETSQCTATLDFTLDAVFNKVFAEFLDNTVKKEASSKLARASVRPLAVVAEVSYEVKERRIIDNKITMNPKQFSISPRPGAPYEARKHLVVSPFDSVTHLKLIQQLNEALGGG